MHIGSRGELTGEKCIRIGFVGCGSHSFRNVYPALQFAHVELVATCDLQLEKAQAYAKKFGAKAAYADYRQMLEKEDLDAVFLVLGRDAARWPLYPDIACDVLSRGKHVWFEKPPAGSCAQVERMMAAAQASGKFAQCGLKKMFYPANVKAKELVSEASFGAVSLATLQYPMPVPDAAAFEAYAKREPGDAARSVSSFVDHLCHPAALLVYLLGMPQTLHYERAKNGAGLATFTFASGAVATLVLSAGASWNGGMERTWIAGDAGQLVTVENNIRVTLHRTPSPPGGEGYGSQPSFHVGTPEQASAVWEPEFSLGQLYNKGLFIQGFAQEIEAFAQSVLSKTPPAKANLEHAWQITRIFEAFAEGPGKRIELEAGVRGRGVRCREVIV